MNVYRVYLKRAFAYGVKVDIHNAYKIQNVSLLTKDTLRDLELYGMSNGIASLYIDMDWVKLDKHKYDHFEGVRDDYYLEVQKYIRNDKIHELI